MVLAQDAAQGSQAGNIVAEQKYQSDLKTYNENLAKEKAAADAKAQADAKAAVDAKAQAAAEAKAKADALAASKNYYATTAPPTQWIYKRGGTRYENPAFTNYEANRPERI
jgi:site-specific recombinase XerD